MFSGRELVPTGGKSSHHNAGKARDLALKDKGNEILAYKLRELELPALKRSVEFITHGRQEEQVTGQAGNKVQLLHGRRHFIKGRAQKGKDDLNLLGNLYFIL